MPSAECRVPGAGCRVPGGVRPAFGGMRVLPVRLRSRRLRGGPPPSRRRTAPSSPVVTPSPVVARSRRPAGPAVAPSGRPRRPSGPARRVRVRAAGAYPSLSTRSGAYRCRLAGPVRRPSLASGHDPSAVMY
ncbi:hypothetical protein DDW44_24225 [Streptomyces tirandamycinicus]|uniref:Uncharacterized protein n=1 Tax=Streptomyces tirandamycinicus TaxID=2174846 RepID=A0A2S1SYS4_9ACTN|nr:hypothetical protein DDW44_24225 [Streptomyces tirandamycinicus]